MKQLLTSLLLASSLSLAAQQSIPDIKETYQHAKYPPIGLHDHNVRDILAAATNSADSRAGSYRGDAPHKFFRNYLSPDLALGLPGAMSIDSLEGTLGSTDDFAWLENFSAVIEQLNIEEYQFQPQRITFSYTQTNKEYPDYVKFEFIGTGDSLTHAWIKFSSWSTSSRSSKYAGTIEYHGDGFLSGSTQELFAPDKCITYLQALYKELRGITE